MGARASLRRLGGIAAFAAFAALAASAGPPPAQAQASAAPRAVPQGTAVRLSALRSGERYRETFRREFDSLTPENEMKMQELQPRRGRFEFAEADELVRFARRHDKAVRGHTLVWGQALPLTRTLRRFQQMGLDVQFTEVDVGTSLLDVTRRERMERQALAYGAAARACNAVRACTRFTTWGFTDGVSWLSGVESGLLFDRSYRPKLAYEAVRGAFAPR